jgi:hypothetical protein
MLHCAFTHDSALYRDATSVSRVLLALCVHTTPLTLLRDLPYYAHTHTHALMYTAHEPQW